MQKPGVTLRWILPAMVLLPTLMLAVIALQQRHETASHAAYAQGLSPTLPIASPTFYCAGSCPSGTPAVTVPPSATIPPGEIPAPTNTQPNPVVTTQPCEQRITAAAGRGGGRRKHHKRHRGLFSGFLPFFIQFINRLLQQLGLPPLAIPTDPGGQIPEPTQPPSDPGQPQPCAPTQQPAPTAQSQEPTSPAQATTVPTTNAQPTTPPTTNGGKSANVEITFYGAWDNDPAGSTDIANPVIHQQAGGVGSYADPLTFASPAGNGAYKTGQIIYVPLVQKYFIKEDECAVSWTAPNGCGAVSHVDLYVGNPSATEAVIACEESLTPGGNAEIIVDPPNNLTYDSTPIWSDSTGKCMKAH